MKFNEKFATDDLHTSMALTSDGCMARMNDDSAFRDAELDTRVDSFGNGAEADERMMMNYLSILTKHGKQPAPQQSIEQFIIKNMDILSEYER